MWEARPARKKKLTKRPHAITMRNMLKGEKMYTQILAVTANSHSEHRAWPPDRDNKINLCRSDASRYAGDQGPVGMTATNDKGVRSLLRMFGWLLLLIVPSAEAAAVRWINQAPIPTWFNVQGIEQISAQECWIASAPLLGDQGELAHTTNAGRTWRVVSMPRQVNAICFVDPLHGWAAGNGFFHTTDGGDTWIQDNDWGTIYDLFFLDAMRGWACGNGSVNYYTTDGGLHWAAVPAPGGSTMGSIWFSNQLRGWSVNLEGQIFRSTDGGHTWALQATVNGTNLQTIQFLDQQEGWVIGGDAFYHTVNGGQTWTRASIPAGTWAHSARFFDRLHAVAVGEFGNIVRTVDGGRTWQTVRSQGTGQRLWDVEYANANTIFLAGDNGVISRSTDAGATWNSIQSGGSAVTHGFDSLDAQRAWAAQDGGEIVFTTNGGTQWVRTLVQGFDTLGKVMDVAFADAAIGWAGGGNQGFSGNRGVLSRSTNGGRSWTQQLEVTDFTFKGLETTNTQTAFAVGAFDFIGGGLVLRTTNGGLSWQNVTPNSEGFRDVFFINSSTGWVVGSSIYKTTNGGSNWTRQYGDGASELDAISFSDPSKGWATGFNNLVLRTTDGGGHWASQNVGAPPVTAITGVTAVNSTTAWIAGWYGFVAQTTDGGSTWRQEPIAGAEQVDFEDARFTGAQRGWVGGNIGIWKSVPIVDTASY